MALLKPRRLTAARKGFSLIELAVGLAVAGLVVGMGSQVLSTKTVENIDNDAAIMKCYADTRVAMRDMDNALQKYYRKNNEYPLPASIKNKAGTAVASKNTVINAQNAKVTGDIYISTNVAIGRFPFVDLGLTSQYLTDCFSDPGIAISGHNTADNYYRYMVSIADPTTGKITVNVSTTASLTRSAIYAIVSHGSSGCHSAVPAAAAVKMKNCTNSALTEVQNITFSRKAGTDPTSTTDPLNINFFDDLVVYFQGK